VAQADQEAYKAQNSCVEQEQNKVPSVSVADTSTNPGAVMVVHFYANVTFPTVERPGRPYYLTRFAKAQLLRQNAVSIFALAVLLHVLEFTNAKESLAGSEVLIGWIT
jgi:hypothetical protein